MTHATSSRVLSLLGLTAAVIFFPLAASAQGVDADFRAGAYADIGESFVGAGLLTRVGGSQWFFNPNAEFVFVERGDLVTVNADFHQDLAWEGDLHAWLGAGIALVAADNGRGSDDTDVGVNLLAGMGFLRGRTVRPYLQGKILLADDVEAVIAFGIRF